MHEQKASERALSQYWSKGVLVYSEILIFQRSSVHKRGWVPQVESNESEDFTEIFGGSIFENLVVSEFEGICIYLVVSQFLLVIGSINIKYW